MQKEQVRELGENQLNAQQQAVLRECLAKKSGGLSLCLGFGKTILSLVVGLSCKSKNPFLVVVSKTLLESWKYEIKKFFGESLKYVVLHQDECDINNKIIKDDVLLVITTVDVVSKFYKQDKIENHFIDRIIVNEGRFNQHEIVEYNRPRRPYGSSMIGGSVLFGKKWSCLIVDEVQKYTNIGSMRCQGLAAICAERRWALSGTMFDEPKTEKVLGYYLIIDDPSFPRNLPAAKKFLTSHRFKGFQASTVHRSENVSYTPPKLNQKIIVHNLSDEEERLYFSMKETMSAIQKALEQYQMWDDIDNARLFGSYLLAMLTYLRQSIVCPLVPIAKAIVDVSDISNKSQMSEIIIENLRKQDLMEWLDDEKALMSSRIKKILGVLESHSSERVLLFTSFRTCLDVIKYFIKDRPVFTLTSTMNMKTRAKVLEQHRKSTNGVLLLTYELGAEGLNLQHSHTVLLADVWWNDGKTQQAIGRVHRLGQESDHVNVYFFTSNTGVEKAVFDKQQEKLDVLAELKNGPSTKKVGSIVLKEIIRLIDAQDNKNLLARVAQK